MTRLVKISVVLVLVLLTGGLAVMGVNKVRNAACLAQCSGNLKNIGYALHNYHSNHGHFPPGTVAGSDLPPDKRLGWVIEIWPAYMEGGSLSRFDRTKAWDATENCPPILRVRHYTPEDKKLVYTEHPVGHLKQFICPSNLMEKEPPLPSPTSYVGLAGVGDDAAELPASNPRAGFFGYDRKITLKDIKDGVSTTFAGAEVLDGGPWTAGGTSSLRWLRLDDAPYLGTGGQFASRHWAKDSSGHLATHFLYVDNSVRPFTTLVSPRVLEAMTTIAGGEDVEGFENGTN